MEGSGGVFPGVISKVETVGSLEHSGLVGGNAAAQLTDVGGGPEARDAHRVLILVLMVLIALIGLRHYDQVVQLGVLCPTETMDGAIISGNCVSACDKNTTYHHQNNPVVANLFAAHGKTLNYVCNIITNENVYLADKQRSSDWTAKLCRLLDHS